jgi:hypothetical protein
MHNLDKQKTAQIRKTLAAILGRQPGLRLGNFNSQPNRNLMSKPPKISRPRGCSLKSFQNNLSDINKYLSYYVFISSQFLRQNSSLIEKAPEKLTTEVFSDNTLSKQFDVKLNLLNSHTLDTDKFVFDSLFLYCCFELDNYFKESYKYIQSVERFFDSNKKVLDNFPTKIIELVTFESLIQIIENLKISTDTSFTENDYLTFEYFRLRRNTIAHRDIEARYSGSMKTFIEKNGTALNEYWNKSNTSVKKLDFTSSNLQFINKDSVVDVVNILRDTTPKLEEKIVNKITNEEWVEFLFSNFKKEVKSYDINYEDKFEKSFNKFTSIKLNKVFEQQTIKKIIYKR